MGDFFPYLHVVLDSCFLGRICDHGYGEAFGVSFENVSLVAPSGNEFKRKFRGYYSIWEELFTDSFGGGSFLGAGSAQKADASTQEKSRCGFGVFDICIECILPLGRFG